MIAFLRLIRGTSRSSCTSSARWRYSAASPRSSCFALARRSGCPRRPSLRPPHRLRHAARRRLAGVHRDARRRAVDLRQGRPRSRHADVDQQPGIVVGDGGALVLIGLTVLGWLALRRQPSVARYFAGLAGVYLVALVVAWWAMTAKPGACLTQSLPQTGEFSHRRGIASPPVSAVAYDLRGTRGYLVADAHGRLVGRVECPMYGTTPDEPDALAVRTGFFARKRRLVPADAIEQIDGQSRVIGLRVDREGLLSFPVVTPFRKRSVPRTIRDGSDAMRRSGAD